jgi:flagellar biosynthesis/type III secretory pathway protein FliH
MARKNGWDTLVSKDRQKANGITEETITESGKVKADKGYQERNKDQNERLQIRAQMSRNKATFVKGRDKFYKSATARGVDAGHIKAEEVHKIMSHTVKNKATMIKKTTNKSRAPDEKYYY